LIKLRGYRQIQNTQELGWFLFNLVIITNKHPTREVEMNVKPFRFDLTDTQDFNFQKGYKGHRYNPYERTLVLKIRMGFYTNNRSILENHIYPYHNDVKLTKDKRYTYHNIGLKTISAFLVSSAFGKECFETYFGSGANFNGKLKRIVV
jgi:hypothetical protein